MEQLERLMAWMMPSQQHRRRSRGRKPQHEGARDSATIGVRLAVEAAEEQHVRRLPSPHLFSG